MAVLDKPIKTLTDTEYLSLCAYHGELMGKLNLALAKQAVSMPWIELSKFAFNTPLVPWISDTYIDYVIRKVTDKCAILYAQVPLRLENHSTIVKTYKRWLEEVENHFVKVVQEASK